MSGVHLDLDIWERRALALERLPWSIPAAVVMGMRDADLDALADSTPDAYWRTLNAIVSRITQDVERRDWRSRERHPPVRGEGV